MCSCLNEVEEDSHEMYWHFEQQGPGYHRLKHGPTIIAVWPDRDQEKIKPGWRGCNLPTFVENMKWTPA